MALQVISSGFGRTGTKSTKDALERLGFGPCHHMYEVMERPEQVPLWRAVAEGKDVDWNDIFGDFRSQVDWPGAHVWRELAETYPKAKVVHTRRPEENWLRSFRNTIGKLMREFDEMPLPPHVSDMMDTARTMIMHQTFGGLTDDPEVLLAAYRKRTEDVLAALPSDRLLVFDVAEGWEPLCAFLDVPVPDGPFPHQNVEADFWEKLKPPA